jgi:starvation-inducible outer membrane lipoprotein
MQFAISNLNSAICKILSCRHSTPKSLQNPRERVLTIAMLRHDPQVAISRQVRAAR